MPRRLEVADDAETVLPASAAFMLEAVRDTDE